MRTNEDSDDGVGKHEKSLIPDKVRSYFALFSWLRSYFALFSWRPLGIGR